MKKQLKPLLLVALFTLCSTTLFAQAPSTEGTDFWVTFLRADSYDDDDKSATMALHISSQYDCSVTISNPAINRTQSIDVTANQVSDFELYSGTVRESRNPSQYDKWSCYSYQSEQVLNTAIHVTSTAPISLFASNYKDKSFDATNVLPTTALLDDYLVQTYPPSVHADQPQGSHFAIIAVEDGETVVDFNLTAKTANGSIGSQTCTLKKGQVFYVWTGKNDGDEADLSGTTVKARNNKKIAVFQGCPHTNIPYKVHDRDHIYSQAMPTAYWGTEFGITASRKHRRDIVAVMAINDGTEVYVNNEDGEPELVHTFDFSKDKKHYWTFEIGEYIAYSVDKDAPSYGKLPEPLVVDSSCYLTTSCPAGVHLFMVSNQYDNPTEKKAEGLVSDPAMLWISPIEQVIKEINFSTFKTPQAKFHFMNILTTTTNVSTMRWNGNSIAQYFHPLRGNSDYSYARIEIQHGGHNLKGYGGFLAHVYGYGERESYAYSCGSSTVQRGIALEGTPIEIDSICRTPFCYSVDLEMKLNIGNNDYESIEWDFGDGTTWSPNPNLSNDEKKTAHHLYSTPGWYDLIVTAVYVNACTGKRHDETMTFSFSITKPDTVRQMVERGCIAVDSTLNGIKLTPAEVADYLTRGKNDTVKGPNCYDTVYINLRQYGIETMEPGFSYEHRDTLEYQLMGADSVYVPEIGKYFSNSADTVIISENEYLCNHFHPYYVHVITCVNMEAEHDEVKIHACKNDSLLLEYTQRRGDISDVRLLLDKITVHQIDGEEPVETYTNVKDTTFTWEAWKDWKYINEDSKGVGHISLPTNDLDPGRYRLTMALVETNEDCKRNARDTFFVERNFTINYPRAIVIQKKLNNVLAVLSSTYNGGYEFIGFQWYKNGEPIEGATGAIYHSDIPFDPNDVYTVALTDTNGVTVNSCDIEPEALPEEPVEEPTVDEGTENAAPAQKLLYRNHMIIRKEGQLFNIYGQKIQ